MTTSTRGPRVAILGARGIGHVHARIFRELGADVCAILGSTEASAAATSECLVDALGVKAKPFFDLRSLLAEPLDAISICTPPSLHFLHLQAVLERGLPVFCEKPMFWQDGDSLTDLRDKLNELAAHSRRRLFVNTSNADFIDAVRARLPAEEVERFSFRFHTQGPWRGPRIAVDLMPHGLSLLIRLLGQRILSSFVSNFTNTRYHCTFSYGSCATEFDFGEGDGPSDLAFSVNGHEFRRLQEGRGVTYRVYLRDVRSEENVPVDDPFQTHILRFLRRLRDDTSSWADAWSEAAANMRLMSQALLPSKTGQTAEVA